MDNKVPVNPIHKNNTITCHTSKVNIFRCIVIEIAIYIIQIKNGWPPQNNNFQEKTNKALKLI